MNVMNFVNRAIVVAAALALFAPRAQAQLTGALNAPVAMGHHHFNTTDMEASRRFWQLLGAVPVQLADRQVMKLPNLIVFLREQAPTGGTIGTTVNHVGVQMPDVVAMVDKLKSAGVPIVTKQEMAGATEDVFYVEAQKIHIAYVMSPEGSKVELLENKSLGHPIENHHIHFYTPDVEGMKKWYVDTFGAEPGQRGGMEAAQLPGVNLTFVPANGEVVGTKGRSLDHIGFEVDGLKAFCETLEKRGVHFDRPYTEVPQLGIAIAFFTDPWGTYIELTEGLDEL
jgi:catechol 2,3-dioxygenase-like lactoylglutathione lyase family enzyme